MSIGLDFDLSGLRELQSRLESNLSTLMRDAVVAGGNAAVMRAKQGPFKDRTGQLRANISSRYIGQRGDWFTVEVVAKMPYASYVEQGTEAHDIYPKAGYGSMGPLRQGQSRRATGKGPHEQIVGRGIALRWKDGAGNQHFARMIHHPGSKAYPFMEPAREFGQLVMDTQLRRGFVDIAARLEY